MQSVFQRLLGETAAERPPGDGGPAAPERTNGEAYGPFVQVFDDRFELFGEAFPRRDLGAESESRAPAELRAALGASLTGPDDPVALVPERGEVFLHITKSMAGTLRRIAEVTDAGYYNASTQQQLALAYEAIGELERSRVGERRFTSFYEFAPWFAALALALLAVEAALRATYLRRYP